MSGAWSIVIVTYGSCRSGRALSFCGNVQGIGRQLQIDVGFHDGRNLILFEHRGREIFAVRAFDACVSSARVCETESREKRRAGMRASTPGPVTRDFIPVKHGTLQTGHSLR